MPIDPSIALGVQPVEPMKQLSSVLGIANGAQQLQNAQLANQQGQQDLQQKQISLQERQGAQGVLKNIKKYQDSQGNIDYTKLMPDIMAVAPTTGHEVINGVFQAQNSAAQAKTAINSLDADSRRTVGNMLYALKGQTPTTVHNVLTDIKASYPNLLPAVEFSGKYLIAPTVQGSDTPNPQLDSALDQVGRMFQGAPEQQAMQTPSGVTVNDNQTTKVVNLKPGASVGMGETIPGTQTEMKLPPTAQVYDPVAKAPKYVAGGQAGPALGEPEAAQNVVAQNTKHYEDIQQKAGAAPLRIHLLDDIEEQSKLALTGDKSAMKKVVSKLAGYFNIQGDEQTATDLMKKDAARLSGGNTDVERLITQAATPNGEMTAEAIHKAVQDLKHQEKLNMAAGKHFSGIPFDSAEYSKKRTAWQSVNPYDYANKSPEERKAIREKLQQTDPEAYKALAAQVKALGDK